VSPNQAATPLDECTDQSPTLEGIALCLDDLFEQAEQDLQSEAKAARTRIAGIRSRSERLRAERAFDAAQKKFFTSRRAMCGRLSGESEDGYNVRANQVRDCFVRRTQERALEIASEFGRRPAGEERTAAQSDPDAGAANSVYGMEWRLVRLVRDRKEIPLPAGYKATLRLDEDGRVSGKGAVNAFSGEYQLKSQGRIEWAQHGFLTTRTLGFEEFGAMDQLFIDALERATRAGMGQTGLVLRNEDSSIALTFVR
jgi:heat shock protein HslJ/uncharacterized protein YecT (DUF1311 family)